MGEPWVPPADAARSSRTQGRTTSAVFRDFARAGPLPRIRPARQAQVADGIRTRDHRDHNPGLYQLSYRHHAAAKG